MGRFCKRDFEFCASQSTYHHLAEADLPGTGSLIDNCPCATLKPLLASSDHWMNKPGKSFLVIGVDGLIGGALARKLALEGATVHTTAKPGSKKAADVVLDLAAADIEQIALPRADVAVLCASINGFAACRRDPATARQVNAVAPEILTRQFRKNGTRVIYLSSSAVFDFQVPHIEALGSDMRPHGLRCGQGRGRGTGAGARAGDHGYPVRQGSVGGHAAVQELGQVRSARENHQSFFRFAVLSDIAGFCDRGGPGHRQGGRGRHLPGVRRLRYQLCGAACHIAKRLGVPKSHVREDLALSAWDSGGGDCDFYLDGHVALYCPDKPNASEAARCVGYGLRAENSKSRAQSRHVSAPLSAVRFARATGCKRCPAFAALPRATSEFKALAERRIACGLRRLRCHPEASRSEVDGRGEENLCRLRDLPSVGGLGAAHLR